MSRLTLIDAGAGQLKKLEAAAAGTLPDLVRRSDLRGDLHCHTTASDGTASIEEMGVAARDAGYEYLAIRPVARNVAAVRRFHAAGFRALGGHVDLTMDLAARRHEWLPGASLHGLDFDY